MNKRVLLASGLGVLVTIVLFGFAFAAGDAGHESLARILFWQNSLLQMLAPLGNMGTPEHPIYEGTPLNFLAFVASFPLGFAVYGGASYAIISIHGSRA